MRTITPQTPIANPDGLSRFLFDLAVDTARAQAATFGAVPMTTDNDATGTKDAPFFAVQCGPCHQYGGAHGPRCPDDPALAESMALPDYRGRWHAFLAQPDDC
jgi:hypothetical protein